MTDPVPLLTVGHGAADQPTLEALLRDAGVGLVVDVRRYPSSRRHPHVSRGRLQRWLADAGIDYRWDERLGGRREPHGASPHTALREAAFRAYADHLASPAARAAVAEVLAAAAERRLALLCAEADWTRCHRRLLADHLSLLAGAEVHHLRHGGGREPHVPSAVVRVEDGRLVYDGGEPTLDLDG